MPTMIRPQSSAWRFIIKPKRELEMRDGQFFSAVVLNDGASRAIMQSFGCRFGGFEGRIFPG